MITEARAYVYSGDWVADCPRECGNTEFLFKQINPRNKKSSRTVQKSLFQCSYCGISTSIEWPTHMNAIYVTLIARPIPHTRNWYPKGHPTALKHRLPDGQTIEDLLQESKENGVF